MIKVRYKICISMVVIMLFFVGCSNANEVSNLIDTEDSTKTISTQEITEEKTEDILKVELIKFFRQYFTPDERSILTLNTYPIKIDEKYWDNYEEFKDDSLELLKGFISSDLEEKMQKQFLTTNIHFPRFVEVNGNVIIGYEDVEDVSYDIIEKNDNNIILTSNVTVTSIVIPKERFNEIYNYDSNKNYYTIKNNNIIIEEDEKDEIKVQCSYILELTQKEDNISIYSIKENSELLVPEKNRRSIINNDFVKRVNYLDTPNKSEEQLIKLFFNQFMNKDKDDYNYYQYAYDMDYDTYSQMLEDLDLKDYMLLEEENYKIQFPKTIIPTKDDIISLKISKEDINTSVHIDTSKKIRKYIVEIPSKVKLADYSMSDIIYQYLVTLEDDKEQGSKIKNIKYIFAKPIETKDEVDDN